MADSIVQNLTKRVFASLADLTGVRLWSGKGAESDALGLEVSELLTSDIVTDDSIDYKALTPKGFNTSLMTTSRYGVGILATTAAIQSKQYDGLLTAGNQNTMQTQWKTDFFTKNGAPNTFRVNNSNYTTSGGALSFQSCLNLSMVPNQKIVLSPALGSGVVRSVSIQYSYRLGTGSALSSSGFLTITPTEGVETLVIAGTFGYFYVSADGNTFGFISASTSNYFLSCSVTLVTEV